MRLDETRRDETRDFFSVEAGGDKKWDGKFNMRLSGMG